MLRALDSAVAGLRAHQNKMDVIGHNLANVNTFGYKAQTYSFKEAVYQTSSPSTGNANGAGGTNAAQYGYGTLMGTIGMDMTASTPTQLSGLNAAIDGEGFFLTYGLSVPQDKEGNDIDMSNLTDLKQIQWGYTRVGQFSLDSEGYLVDGNGNFVYGFPAQAADAADKPTYTEKDLFAIRMPREDELADIDKTPISGPPKDADSKAATATSVEINAVGKVTAIINGNSVNLGTVAIVTFQNPNGLTKAGATYYNAVEGDNTGTSLVTVPGGDAAGLIPGYIEASNVDLAKEFAEMITTHRGFQANSKMITVSDEMLSELVSMKR